MTAPINLNRERKRRALADSAAKADQNRLKFGRSKAEKTNDKMATSKAEKALDSHKRDT